MDLNATEQTVMDRFADKTHIAGGAKAGYVLRRQAITAVAGEGTGEGTEEGIEGAIAALVGRGLLVLSEGGDFVYLTGAGVGALTGDAPAVETPAVEASAEEPA